MKWVYFTGLTLFLTLLQSIFPKYLLFCPFIPFLVLIILEKKLETALWAGLFIGIFVDFLSSMRFGFFILSNLATIRIMYSFKNHFHMDKPVHFILCAWIFSFIFSIFQGFFFFIFDKTIIFTGKWIVIDLIFFSILDGLYGLIIFYWPYKIIKKMTKNLPFLTRRL